MRNFNHRLKGDFQFALRTLRKSPAFLLVATVSLALGIGANTAIFTLIDQVLLRPLPVKEPQQLVLLWSRGQHYGSNNGRYKISYPMYTDFRDKNPVFSGMFSRYLTDMSLSFSGRTERVQGEMVSGTYFPELGVGAALGRVFAEADDTTAGGAPYAVLSYRYWVSRFAADPKVIGEKLIVNGYPMTIVGVSQAGFDGLDPGSSPQVRVPIVMKIQLDQLSVSGNNLTNRRARWVNAYGRLKPGVSMQQAKSGLQPLFHQMLEMEVQQAEFSRASPDTKNAFLKMSLDMLPASSGNTELQFRFSSSLIVLMSLVGVVLLIACANLANLLVARATARQKEIAVRLALGASRARIVAQLMVESAVLAVTGGIAGLLIAALIDRMLVSFLPPGSSPVTLSARPDTRVLLFTLGVSVLTCGLFGLVPALQSTRPDLAPTLKDQAGGVIGGGAVIFRKTLVGLQVMLSLLLLIASGLFIHSLKNLKDLDPGFQTRHLLTFTVNPVMSGYKPEQTGEFYRQLKAALDTMPGVESSALAAVSVLVGNEWDSSVTVEGYAGREGPQPHMNYVSPDYFRTFGVAQLQGRDFTTKDDAKAQPVAIVNQRFAQKFFEGRNPIGRHIGMGGDPGTKTPIEIVGLVHDTKYESMRAEIPYEVYIPYRQQTLFGMSIYVRAVGEPTHMLAEMRKTVARIAPDLPVAFLKTVDAQMDESLLTERLVASLSTAFSILATILAAIGLYGVVSYTAGRRTREIGIRMALGASRGNVVWLVMREIAILTVAGIGVGLAAAWGLTNLVRQQLYGVQPNDLGTVVLAALAIALVSAAAGYLPARRASRVDPLRSLRWE
jgi:predicted permease